MALRKDAFILRYFYLITITKPIQDYDGNRVVGISLSRVDRESIFVDLKYLRSGIPSAITSYF